MKNKSYILCVEKFQTKVVRLKKVDNKIVENQQLIDYYVDKNGLCYTLDKTFVNKSEKLIAKLAENFCSENGDGIYRLEKVILPTYIKFDDKLYQLNDFYYSEYFEFNLISELENYSFCEDLSYYFSKCENLRRLVLTTKNFKSDIFLSKSYKKLEEVVIKIY